MSESVDDLADKVDAVLRQLAAGPEFVTSLVAELDPTFVKRRPRPGVWSAHEHACHLPDVQPLFVERLDMMLTSTDPVIQSYEPSRDDQDGSLLSVDLQAAMERFVTERQLLLNRLHKISEDQWAIAAEHDEYSHYSVFIMFRHLALHDLYHAYRIEERLLLREWPDDT